MKIASVLTVTLLVATCAHADFSYTTTRKMGGAMAGMAGPAANEPSKYYLKGQKMKTETGDTSITLDFEAQTITTVNNARKSYSVRPFSDFSGAAKDIDAKIDVRETGQKKNINGYNASELVMTMEVASPAAAQMGTMQMEMDMWISPDPPGVNEMRSFYQKNMSRFPWAAMGAGGNPSMQKAMGDLQRKMAEMNGVPVLQVVRMKSGAGAPAMPQMNAEQMEQMKQAMARLQAQGGQQAAAAQAMMARMGAMNGASGGSSNYLMEMTMESTGFSTNSVPDSVFAIPAGYQKTDK